MRTFRAMSLSTLVLLAVAATLSWHISFWADDNLNAQPAIFQTLLGFTSFAVLSAVLTLVLSMEYDENKFGTSKFMGHLFTVFGGVGGSGLFLCLIIGGFAGLSQPVPGEVDKYTFDGLEFAVVTLSWLIGYGASFLTLVFVHGNNSWTGEVRNSRVRSISERRAG